MPILVAYEQLFPLVISSRKGAEWLLSCFGGNILAIMCKFSKDKMFSFQKMFLLDFLFGPVLRKYIGRTPNIVYIGGLAHYFSSPSSCPSYSIFLIFVLLFLCF